MVRNYNDNVNTKLVIAEFFGYALHCWDKTSTHRARNGRRFVETWTELHALMKKIFVLQHFYRELQIQIDDS